MSKKAKIRAKKRYKDLLLGKQIKQNTIYIVDFERAKEIANHPKDLIEIMEVFDEVLKDNDVIHPLNEKSKKELVEMAKERNIKVSGLKKSELIEKLIETK